MKETSKWWWIGGSHKNTSHSSSAWLNSTLSELDAKTKEILRVIDEVDDEADTFVKRAKNYYEKKPKLIAMVEDSYRSHRSLAYKYDDLLIKHSPLVPCRHNSSTSDEFRSDFCEETEFEVDSTAEGEKDQILEFGDGGETMKEMKEELERLREENRVYKEMMMSEKRQVTSLFTTDSIIRQQQEQQQIETNEAKASMTQIKLSPLPPPSAPSNAKKQSFNSAQSSSTTDAEKSVRDCCIFIPASAIQRPSSSEETTLMEETLRKIHSRRAYFRYLY